MWVNRFDLLARCRQRSGFGKSQDKISQNLQSSLRGSSMLRMPVFPEESSLSTKSIKFRHCPSSDMPSNIFSDAFRRQPRAILSKKQAVEIFLLRSIGNTSPRSDACLYGRSSAVACKYRISPKAVRDIWNRRTWTVETRHLWIEDEQPMIRSSTSMQAVMRRIQPRKLGASNSVSPSSVGFSSCSSSPDFKEPGHHFTNPYLESNLDWKLDVSKSGSCSRQSQNFSSQCREASHCDEKAKPVTHVLDQAALKWTESAGSETANPIGDPSLESFEAETRAEQNWPFAPVEEDRFFMDWPAW